MNAVELRFLGALAESFLIVAVLGPVFIPLLHRLKLKTVFIYQEEKKIEK